MPALNFDEFDPPKLKDAEQAIRGHEGGGPGVVSPQGAGGSGQIMPGTFKQYAQPGELFTNDKDNIAVSNRILRKGYENYGGDVDRMATAYFSGDGNVAPKGNPTPWKANRRDVNEPVSAYVANVESRMPKRQAMTFDEFKPGGGGKGGALSFDEFKPQTTPPPQMGPPQRPPGPMDPSIAAHAPPAAAPGFFDPEKQVYAMLKNDPMGTLKKLGVATVQEAKDIVGQLSPQHLAQVAHQVGAETAANTATPATAGEVANLAQLGMRGAPGGRAGLAAAPKPAALGESVGVAGPPPNEASIAARTVPLDTIKSPAIKTSDGRVVEGPNHDAIKSAGTEGEEGFTTAQGHFVDRSQGAALAKITRQAPAGTDELHSQDLHAPQPAGADATSKAVLDGYKAVPPVPGPAIVKSIEDGGQRLRGAATSDKATWQQYVDNLPPEVKDPKLQERFYKFNEDGMKFGPSNEILSEPEQALFKKYALPIVQENRDLYGELKKFNPEMFEEFDPDYVHRVVKGKTREYDPWMGEAGAANPMGGYRRRTADSAQDRVYYVMESDKGTRKLLAKTDHGMMVLNKGEPPQPLSRYGGQASKVDDKFKAGGESWTIKHAKTDEIERETDRRYYKNSMTGLIKNNMQLKAAVRAVNEVNRVKQTPEFEAYTRPLGASRPDNYVTTDFPPFRDRWMDPKFAAAIDSFWTAPKMALGSKIAAIHRFVLQTLFWSPLVHAANVATHAFVARGFDWLNPMAYGRLAKTAPEAVYQVVTQGEKYKEMLRDGSGLIYGSVANEEFHRKMLQGLGEAIKREPYKWDPIARVLGVGPSDLVRAIYSASSRTLWATSDAFMMQRVLELRMKGMTKLDAIEEAEKHIPNYRIPSQVLNSPTVAQVLKDPSLFSFTRYDYGVFKSYAHMAKDLAKGAPQEKLKAVGNIMALGFLTYYVWPHINAGLQQLTGNKNLELGPRGALKGPMLLRDLASGGKGLGDIIPSLLTLAPIPSMAVQGLAGFRDHFGRNIVEPGDWQQHRMGRVGAQAGEAVAQDVSPLYGEVAQGMENRKTGGLAGAGERVLMQGLGIRKTPVPYKGRTSGGTAEQQANYRRTHPRGPIEQLERGAERWLKQ